MDQSLIPKAAWFWILVEGHSASRLCAAACSFGSDGGCEKVDQSPHGRNGHAPPFFPLQSPISKGQWDYSKDNDAQIGRAFDSVTPSCLIMVVR